MGHSQRVSRSTNHQMDTVMPQWLATHVSPLALRPLRSTHSLAASQPTNTLTIASASRQVVPLKLRCRVFKAHVGTV
jgi:hypothetical protein